MKYSISRQFEKNRELQADNFVLVYQMAKSALRLLSTR
ncbi:capsular polysaccharide synthesis enzyme CpsH [Vibrio sp. JCM 19052]|nr:capsular polysaccharide synthesis enzyme CpsH [Vibrio sp. JCM 19052]